MRKHLYPIVAIVATVADAVFCVATVVQTVATVAQRVACDRRSEPCCYCRDGSDGLSHHFSRRIG